MSERIQERIRDDPFIHLAFTAVTQVRNDIAATNTELVVHSSCTVPKAGVECPVFHQPPLVAMIRRNNTRA